jgi:hypothetical protein
MNRGGLYHQCFDKLSAELVSAPDLPDGTVETTLKAGPHAGH